MVASEKQPEKNEVTAWSYKSEYKCNNKKSFGDELLEKSFICFASDSKIIKRNRNINEGTESFITDIVEDIWRGKNVIHEAKLEGGHVTSKEQVLIALTEVEKQETSAARVKLKSSESQKDTTKRKVSGEERSQARNPDEVIEKEIVCLEENFENTETILSFAMNSEQSMPYCQGLGLLEPKKDKMEVEIYDMKKEIDAAKIESSHACSQVKSLQGNMMELGKVVKESSVASKSNLKRNQELLTSRYEYSRLESSIKVLKKDIVNLEEQLGNAVTSKREQKMLNEKSIAPLIEEKDKVVGRMELTLTDMKKELDASEIDCFKAGSSHTCNQVKNLRGKMVELGKVLKESSVTSKSDIKRNQELLTSRYEYSRLESSIKVLKKDIVNLEEQLGNAVSSKREEKMLNEKSIASIIDEKDKVVGRMELTLTDMKKELDATKIDCFQTGSRVKHLTGKIAKLENAATKKSAALNMHLKSTQELERFLQKNKESKTALTASFSSTDNIEESLVTNQYIASINKEREDAEAMMESKISEMKKELDTSKKGYSPTINHVQTLEEKVVHLENTVTEITAASNMHLKAKREFGRFLEEEKLKFEEELKIAQSTAVTLTAKLEKIWITNKSISLANKEKDNVVALMELNISGMEKELDVSKIELQQTGRHVKNLKGEIAELKNTMTETTATSNMYLNSKEHLEIVLQGKLELAEKLRKAQATVLSSSAKLEKSLITNKSISLVIKEKDNSLTLIEAQISGMKEELDASQKDLFQSRTQIKALKEKISESEDLVTEIKITSTMHLKSKQDLEMVSKEENLRFEKELEKAQAAVVSSNAKLEKNLLLSNESISSAMKEKDSAAALMELKIYDMKKELDSSQKELFEKDSQVKTQKGKIEELEIAVKEKTVALSMYLSSKNELETVLTNEKLKFREELKKAQASVISSTAQLEETLLTNKSISLVIKEKDNAIASMELEISEIKKELEVSQKELSWMRSNVKKQDQTIAQVENSLVKHAAVSAANLKSKNDLEIILKKRIAKLETELEKAQEATPSSEARTDQEMRTYQTISSSLKDRDKTFILMKLKIRSLEDKLGASKEDCYRTVGQARSLHRKVMELEKAAEDRSVDKFVRSSMDFKSRLQSELELRNKTLELQRELDATRNANAKSAARSKREADARAARLLERTEELEDAVRRLARESMELRSQLHAEEGVTAATPWDGRRPRTTGGHGGGVEAQALCAAEERDVAIYTMRSVAAELRECGRSGGTQEDLERLIADLEGGKKWLPAAPAAARGLLLPW